MSVKGFCERCHAYAPLNDEHLCEACASNREVPWKPDEDTILREEVPSYDAPHTRIVHLPAVESFGRLEKDKWLAVKTLEESAELVEAAKRWLKPADETDLDAAVRLLQERGLLESSLAPEDRQRLLSGWRDVKHRQDREDMLSELADVLQTCANLAAALDVSDAELRKAMDECRERNRRKGRL